MPGARVSRVLYTVGLVLSALVGTLHFFPLYAFAWHPYIPDAPEEIYSPTATSTSPSP